MTIVEVSVAAFLLLVGVVGTLALLTGAQAATDATRAREGATSLAREVLERTRNLSYADLTPQSLVMSLQAMPGLSDFNGGAAGWTIRRRDVTYTVDLGVCTYDDAKDGAGAHDLGIFCTDGPSAGATDVNPDDYRRVTVEVSWTAAGRTRSIRQRTVVNNTGSAVGPRIATMTPPGGQVTSGSIVSIPLTTSVPSIIVPWTLDGSDMGYATGSGTAWNISWTLGGVLDGSYILSARAFNEIDVAGNARSVTVTVNRSIPALVNGFAAGRNGGVVDLEWKANPERDVIGYRVWRVSGGVDTIAPGCDMIEASSCIDMAPPSGALTYKIAAYDRDAAGAERKGVETTKPVNATNTGPNPPTNLQASTSQGATILAWEAPVVPDPDPGGTIDFYRIYRDGQAYGDRYDRTGLGTDLTYTDTAPGGVEHEYSITAVDDQLAESTIVGPVVR